MHSFAAAEVTAITAAATTAVAPSQNRPLLHELLVIDMFVRANLKAGRASVDFLQRRRLTPSLRRRRESDAILDRIRRLRRR